MVFVAKSRKGGRHGASSLALSVHTTTRLAAIGLLAGLTVEGTFFRAPVFAQATPQATSAGHLFASDAGLVLNFIKPDRTADFETIVEKLKEALSSSDKPERSHTARG